MANRSEKDALGDRMKDYENTTAGVMLIRYLPVMARMDGRSFSRFTHDMERPYDPRMTGLMQETTAYLVQETNANCGYTQSDEISLTWYTSDYEKQLFFNGGQLFFNGRLQKMTSVLASMATVFFNSQIPVWLPDLYGAPSYLARLPHFDARVWNVPTLEEGANCFLWRERDAVKNSITMAAQSYYSHNELMYKNSSEKQEMLFQKGINWNNYPTCFKRGVYVQRRESIRKFTTDELGKLPPKHHAHSNPELLFERTDWGPIEMPPLGTVTNRVQVIYEGAEPTTQESTNSSSPKR